MARRAADEVGAAAWSPVPAGARAEGRHRGREGAGWPDWALGPAWAAWTAAQAPGLLLPRGRRPRLPACPAWLPGLWPFLLSACAPAACASCGHRARRQPMPRRPGERATGGMCMLESSGSITRGHMDLNPCSALGDQTIFGSTIKSRLCCDHMSDLRV